MTQQQINHHRRFLLLALAGTCATSLWPAFSTNTPNFRSYPFSLGVASGSPSSDGFVLWTRLVDEELDPRQAIEVRWEVFEDAQPAAIVASGSALALPELAHSIHVEVAGLKPDHWYGYRFMTGNATSPIGRSRTLPTAGAAVSSLRFAYASCQRWEDGYYTAYRHMLRENLDLVVFLGDYIYEYATRDGVSVRPHSLPAIRTLHDYRQRYALYRSDADLQSMHAACPWLITWDDHEVQNNYGGFLTASEESHFSARKNAAYQAFYEHMPLRTSALMGGLQGLHHGQELRIYNNMNFGNLARFHILDNRQYRDTPLCRPHQKPNYDGICEQLPSDSRSLLGLVQESWLDNSIREAAQQGIGWNLFAQQTAFSPRNYIHGHGKRFVQDSWDGYPESRERLLASVAAHKPNNPVFLGGDIHQNWVANVHEVPYDAASNVIASEFCGTSLTSRNGTSKEQADHIARSSPHCLLDNVEKRGYGVVQLQPKQATVYLRVLDNVALPDSGIGTLASFAVENGHPQIQRAG